MKKPPLISVITVCYNAVVDIEKTMQSVLNQPNQNIEYIVIDGNSTDGTVDIIKKYADRLAYWVSESDEGIYDAMNKGIAVASGEYIIFINIGDRLLFLPTKTLKDVLNKSPIGVCGRVINEKNIVYKPRFDFRMRFQNQIPHQGMFYKRRLIRYYDSSLMIVADYDLNLELYSKGEKIYIIPDIVSFHDMNGISNTNKSIHESFKVIRKRYGNIGVILSWIYRKAKSLKSRIINFYYE